MYYDQESIEKNLICMNCYLRFDTPKSLPCCNESLCNRCLISLQNSDKTVKCPFCMHEIENADDLKVNKLLFNLLNLKPIKLSRGDLFERLTALMRKIESKLENFNLNVGESLEYKVKTYCEYLKYEIQLNIETQIDKLNKLEQKLFNQINLYEAKCLENANLALKPANKGSLNELNEQFKRLKDSFNASNTYISDNDLKEYLKEAKLFKLKLNFYEYNINYSLFNGKLLYLMNEENNLKQQINTSEMTKDNEVIEDHLELIKLNYKYLNTNLDISRLSNYNCLEYDVPLTRNNDLSNEFSSFHLLPVDSNCFLLLSQYYHTQEHCSNTEINLFELVIDQESGDGNKSIKKIHNLFVKNYYASMVNAFNKNILIIKTQANGANCLKQYDLKFNLINTIEYLDYKPRSIISNEIGIYVLSFDDYRHNAQQSPAIHVYDWNLNKINAISEHLPKDVYTLINCVDKKIFASNNEANKIYVLNELDNSLIATISINLDTSAVYIDALLRLYRLHLRSKRLTVYAIDTDDVCNGIISLNDFVLYENELKINSNFINAFSITNNGYLIINDYSMELAKVFVI